MVRRFVFWFLVGKVSLIFLCSVAFSLYLAIVAAEHYESTLSPTPVFHIDAAPPALSTARAFAVFDASTGALLAGADIETPYPIASVTKLPAAAALRSLVDLEATTVVTAADVAAEGRAGKLEAGEQYSYRELLFPLLLESSNDAAAALERAEEGALIAAMNAYASSAGTGATQFVDASGLSDRNVASAYDLTLLGTRLFKEEKYLMSLSSLSQHIGAKTGWVNNSPVASEGAYLGGKHGYTQAAGRTILAFFDEPFRAGRRPIGYVILGSENLAADTATLREFVATSIRFE